MTRKALMPSLALMVLLALVTTPAVSSDCFPDMVKAGVTLEGDNVTFEVLDVKACWVKAVVCSRGHCRAEAYWLHASKIELFKAGEKQ